MKIIKQRELIESVSFTRQFDYADMPGAGFGFDSDAEGNVNADALNPCARKNYDACLTGEIPWGEGKTRRVVDLGVQRWEHSYVAPAVGQCACNAHVDLDGFTNTCDRCGRDYNMSGHLLAPRSQWGEETGETADEIMMADADYRAGRIGYDE